METTLGEQELRDHISGIVSENWADSDVPAPTFEAAFRPDSDGELALFIRLVVRVDPEVDQVPDAIWPVRTSLHADRRLASLPVPLYVRISSPDARADDNTAA